MEGGLNGSTARWLDPPDHLLPLGLDPAKIDLDPCPIAAANIQQLSNVTLPDKSPLGLVGATLTGTLSLFDDAGGKVMDVGIKGKINHK